MDEILFRVLSERVGGYLEAVDRLARGQPEEVAAELRRLASAWRALLRAHAPAGRRGRCAECGRRGRSGMCLAWRVATAYFVRRRAEGP